MKPTYWTSLLALNLEQTPHSYWSPLVRQNMPVTPLQWAFGSARGFE
jgi:hypothetical protein